ncbi:MAG: phospholipid carrier-dependent glycosyltransferase, partial [Thermoflexia bacterium]
MKRWESAFLLVGILLVALSVRVVGLGWGEGQPIHPDEEFLRQVTVAVQWPNSLTLYLDTSRSPLNPYNRGYGFFVYGTFPLFLTRAVGEALDQGCRNGEAVSLLSRWLAPVLLGNPAVCWPGAFSGTGTRHLGRLLAALFDTGSVLFVFLAARVLASGKDSPALPPLAALLYALTVLPIQQSHFYTVDSFANFFVAATLYLALALAQTQTLGWGVPLAFLGGLAIGLGVACKISVWPLGLLVALAVFLHARRSAHGDVGRAARAVVLLGLLALVGAFLAFRLAQPYAFLGPGFFGLRLNPRWLQNMAEVRSLMSGAVDTYPGHQWT